MNEISIQENLPSLIHSQTSTNCKTDEKGNSFSEYLENAIGQVRDLRNDADCAVNELASGKNKDIHNTMIALEKADISFQLMLQVRNKIISAYETIMHMNI